MSDLGPKHYEFGQFRLDPGRRMLLDGNGRPVDISAKAFDFLVYLVENSGRVVERAELMDSLWPRAIVEENTLSQVVLRLRNAIGERCVVTVKGRGYQFAEEVRTVAAGEGSGQSDATGAVRNILRVTLRNQYAIAALVVLLVGLVGGVAYWYQGLQAVPVSIAVLPFENLSPDPDQEYFADGLTMALIDSLSPINGLDVRGRASSFYYKGQSEALQTIAQGLNVAYVLDGTVFKAGNQLRVTPQLIDTRTGSSVWSETYDQRPVGDIFAVQDDIVQKVANALEIKLRVGSGRWPGMTHNVEAYDAYLRAMSVPYYLSGADGTLRKIEHLEFAVALDESFALAWLFLGRAYAAHAELGVFLDLTRSGTSLHSSQKRPSIERAL